MACWNDLTAEYGRQPAEQRNQFIQDSVVRALSAVGTLCGDRNVLVYGSAFLQKPTTAGHQLQIMPEDINGFMATLYGMDWSKGLTLILHTPGGVTTAAQTIVSYLLSKFDHIQVIVPAFAMSAGTMISLAAHSIVMGRQSQLGPIDPQMPINGHYVSAQSIVDQFEWAKSEILANPVIAHAWAPILQTIGPAMLQEATNAIEYSREMVEPWLRERMFVTSPNAAERAAQAAAYFGSAANHKNHGRRVDRQDARKFLVIEDLEDRQDLQEAVLTLYHWMTIIFEQSPAVKFMATHHGRSWLKNAQ